MPGWRSSSSPAPSKRASQIDWGATPRFRSSTTCWLASSSEPVRRVSRAGRPRPRRSGLPAYQPSRIRAARAWLCRPGRSAGVVVLGRVALARAGAGHRPASGGPARRAASRCTGASANCWPRRSPCGRCRGSRGTVAEEQLVDLVGPGGAGQPGDRRVGGRLVPAVHRRDERLAARPAGGTADSSTGAIVQFPSRTSLGLRVLEVVERPEDRQPAVGSRATPRLARCAELTTSTAWNLNPTLGRGWTLRTPASSSAASDFLVAQPLLDPPGDLLQQPLARGLLQQPDQGLDLGLEPHDLRVQLRLVGRDRPEPRQEAQVAQAHQRAARRGRPQETAVDPFACSWLLLSSNPTRIVNHHQTAIITREIAAGNDARLELPQKGAACNRACCAEFDRE